MHGPKAACELNLNVYFAPTLSLRLGRPGAGRVVVSPERRFLLLYTFLRKYKNKKIMVFFSSCKVVQFFAELLAGGSSPRGTTIGSGVFSKIGPKSSKQKTFGRGQASMPGPFFTTPPPQLLGPASRAVGVDHPPRGDVFKRFEVPPPSGNCRHYCVRSPRRRTTSTCRCGTCTGSTSR